MSRWLKNAGVDRIAAVGRRLCSASLLLLMISCGSGNTDNPPAAPASSLKGNITTNILLASSNTAASYQISVYLPADYAATTDSLPVIYALDGGVDNGDRFIRMATITQELGVRAILIGIGGYARRDIDYRLPGAVPFHAFVTLELIPFIESRYRINPGTRTLAGHSYGGFFVVVALTLDRPDHRYFEKFIAQDLSSSDQEAQLFAMEQQLFTASAGQLPDTTLVISGDSLGGYAGDVEDVYQRFLSRNYQGLNLQRIPDYALGHQEMFEPSFRDSIRLVFQS